MTMKGPSENPGAANESTVDTNSCLYESRVVHQRFAPRNHRFQHRMFQFYLNLDELAALSQRLRLFSHNHFNLYNFREADFLEKESALAQRSLKVRLLGWLNVAGVATSTISHVQLLTLPRVAGCSFVPVSFYVCLDQSREPVCAVAEVHNTFGEVKPYLIPVEPGSRNPARCRARIPKNFYVSPYSHPGDEFEFQIRLPDNRFEIQVDDLHEGKIVLTSRFWGERRALTDGALLALTLRHPLVTFHAVAAIHWQALRLWLKRVPWLSKAANQNQQTGILRSKVSPAAPLAPPVPESHQP